MRRNKMSKVNVQEIICLAILVVIAIALLMNFTNNSRSRLRDLVENGIVQELETCSARITADMDKVTGAVNVADQVLEGSWQITDDIIEDMLTVIPDSCEAYLAAYCKLDGSAMTSDKELVSLNGTEYFSRLKGTIPFFTYVKDDGVTGSEAIMYAQAVVRGNGRRGYILAFLPQEFPVPMVQDSGYENRAFFAIMDREGNVYMTFGNTENTELLVNDFWTNLKSYVESRDEWALMERQLQTGRIGSVHVDAGSEERLICTAPLQGTDWLLVMGLETSYVTEVEESVWDNNSRIQLWLCILLVGILMVIIAFSAKNGQKNMEESRELENKADTDLLTGLNNKIATERKIAEYMQHNPNSQAMMVVLDIDNFKKINDTMGHGFGDEVLRNLGHRLSAMFRSTDILGRLGGDEFVLLLKDIKDEESLEREGKKLEAFFHQFEVGEYVKYSVTASLGAAVFPRDADTFEGMYKAADTALYTAKRRGKNQLAFYEKRKVEKE